MQSEDALHGLDEGGLHGTSLSGLGLPERPCVQAASSDVAEAHGADGREVGRPERSVAMAVQRGNAMTFLEGYDRALHAALAKHAASAKQKAVVEQEEDDRGIETTESESVSEDEHDDEEDDGSEEEEEKETAP